MIEKSFKVKILLLSRYSRNGASSRVRLFQFVDDLSNADIEVDINSLFSEKYLTIKYSKKSFLFIEIIFCYLNRIFKMIIMRKDYDYLWIEKELFPYFPYFFEKFFLRRFKYVLDYDDAIFEQYKSSNNLLVRHFLYKKISSLISKSFAVLSGNSYIEAYAKKAGATRVFYFPTVIDLDRYSIDYSIPLNQDVVIVWIGTPATVKYLEILKGSLVRLSLSYNVKLKIIGAKISIPGVKIDCIEWTEDREVQELLTSDIGIMPLLNSPWEQGKCGYKLIQYMGCRLPVIASPVGANLDILKDGINGYFADSEDDWYHRMRLLISDSKLRKKFGDAGYNHVKSGYSKKFLAPKIIKLFE